MQTSALVAINEAEGWARTMGRFYRLGARYKPQVKPVETFAAPENPSPNSDSDETPNSIPRF